MVGYYFKIAAKAFGKYRFHSAVSLVGLTLGFVCFTAANVVAVYLSSWDRHFPDSDRIFTLNASNPNPRGDGLFLVPRHLAPLLRTEFPEIELATTESPTTAYNVSIGDTADSMRITFVEGDFLEIFPLELVAPSRRPAALPPNTALIMEAAALERFGTTDVVGRSLVIGQREEVTIGGVVRTLARPSHLVSILPGSRTELIAPMRVAEQLRGFEAGQPENWNDKSFRTYVKVARGASVDSREFGARLVRFSERHVPPTYYATGPYLTIFSLHPLEESGRNGFMLLLGDLDVAKLLVFTGFLVLFVGCLNYSNLVVAQLTHRSHEICVHKVIGAKRRQLMAQHSLESLLVAGLAFCTAFAVCGVGLATIGALRDVGFHAGLLLTPGLWLTSLGGVFVIVLIAGAYPALRVTRASLIDMLRPAGSTGQSHRLRSLLVGTQFAFSGAFLILAIFVFSQNRTMVDRAKNESVAPVMVLRGLLPQTDDELDRLEAALRRSDSIAFTTRSKVVPWQLGGEAVPLWREANPQSPFAALHRIAVGHDYFETMSMPIVAGRAFSKDVASDLYPAPRDIPSAYGPYSVVIDSATATRLGWPSAEQAIGEQIYTSYLPPVVDEPRFMSLTVVGVVENRPLEIAAIGVTPTHVFMLSPTESGNVIVRPRPGATQAALAHIDDVWGEFYPGSRAKPEFVGDIFDGNYAIFEIIGNMLAALALFSFAISTIGLIGMATFIVRLRQREVGIRKILGANKRRMLRMLLTDFAKPVLIANLVAWPIGLVLSLAYLRIFYVRAPVTPIPFVLCLLLSVAVAVLAVVYQARRSSGVRPATVLKYE
jgi:putative ABC transport system permease protein